MLLPLVQNFSDVVKVSLYHSPSLRGLLKLLLPERFNETVALTHLKVYLTDDTIIMSGSVISFVSFNPLIDNLISSLSLTWETSQHFVTHCWFPHKMTSEKQVQKFHTDDTSLPRSGSCFWLVVPHGKFASTNLWVWVVMRHQYGIYSLGSQSHFLGKPVVVSGNVSSFFRLSYPPPLWTYFLCPLYLLFLVPPLFFPCLFFSSLISFLFFLFLFHPPLHSSFLPLPSSLIHWHIVPSLLLTFPFLTLSISSSPSFPSLISLGLLLAYGVHLF